MLFIRNKIEYFLNSNYGNKGQLNILVIKGYNSIII